MTLLALMNLLGLRDAPRALPYLPLNVNLETIRVSFSVDVYGRLTVSAQVPGARLEVRHRMQHASRYFSERAVQRLLEKAQREKQQDRAEASRRQMELPGMTDRM